MPLNSWKLPRHNFKEKAKCQECVDSWKNKANTHSYNASRLKFALMCFLEGNTQEYELPQSDEEINPIPLDDDPTFPPGEEGEKLKKQNELYGCGICGEKMVKVGAKKPIIYSCGHSNCAECFNGWLQTKGNNPPCPYCRDPIEKAIRLFTD